MSSPMSKSQGKSHRGIIQVPANLRYHSLGGVQHRVYSARWRLSGSAGFRFDSISPGFAPTNSARATVCHMLGVIQFIYFPPITSYSLHHETKRTANQDTAEHHMLQLPLSHSKAGDSTSPTYMYWPHMYVSSVHEAIFSCLYFPLSSLQRDDNSNTNLFLPVASSLDSPANKPQQ